MSELANGISPVPGTRPAVGLVVGLLVLVSSVSIMSTDMYTPSLPDLAVWFGTTPTQVKLTISLNMLAYGLAQLVHGPLSDRFGRRPVMLVSLLCVAVLSLGCAAAQTIDQLIAARILLGFAAAAEAVVGLAIIKDLYTEREQIKALALLGMVIAITPAVAPILGGYLHVLFGWQSNFFVISGAALLALLLIGRWLPESTTPDPDGLRMQLILRGYRKLLRNRDFLIHSGMLGVAMGLIFVFVTGAPFVIIDMLHVAADRFGYYQASMVLAFFLGSVLASRLADHWQALSLLTVGVVLMLVGTLSLCLVIGFDVVTPLTFTGSFMLMTFGMGPLFAVAPSRALRSIQGQAGTASAMLSSIQLTMAGIAAVLISVMNDGTARPMAVVTVFLGCLLAILLKVSAAEDRGRVSL